MHNLNQSHISMEFHLQPHENGFLLVNPNENKLNLLPCVSIQNLLHYNTFNFFLLDVDSRIELINESNAMFCDLDSPAAAIGKSVFDFCPRQVAEMTRKNDIEVLTWHQPKILDEIFLQKNNEELTNFLSIKYPLYGFDHQPCGIVGVSIALLHQPLAESLLEFSKLGFLPTNIKNQITTKRLKFNQAYFTKRESDIVHHTLTGKSAKQIAMILNISPRTVEWYLENIKYKLGVSSKYELIAKLSEKLLL